MPFAQHFLLSTENICFLHKSVIFHKIALTVYLMISFFTFSNYIFSLALLKVSRFKLTVTRTLWPGAAPRGGGGGGATAPIKVLKKGKF